MTMLGLGRLGLDHLAKDHWNSLVTVDEEHGDVRLSWLDVAIFFVLPAAVGVAAWLTGARINSFGGLIEGTAILTGLLFGLLTHILMLGLRLFDDPRQTRSSRLVILTDELRGNVSYAIGVGIALTGAMMLVGAFVSPGEKGYEPALSGVMLAVILHLLLTLYMILKRIRSTYKQLGK